MVGEDPTKREDEEQSIYNEESREELTEGDGIDELEEGFMKGYEEEASMAECANCKAILSDKIIEEEIDGETYRFCCEECATKFKEKLNHHE